MNDKQMLAIALPSAVKYAWTYNEKHHVINGAIYEHTYPVGGWWDIKCNTPYTATLREIVRTAAIGRAL